MSFLPARLTAMAVLAAALCCPAAARAQDSFARVADHETGRPFLSVLGSGIGMAYASLALELRCPVDEAWTIDVTGVRAAAGTAVELGFGDASGGWTPISAAPLRYDERSLSVIFDHAAFHAALARSRAEHPDAGEAEIRIMIGEAVGLTVNRDSLAREMTDFARDCDELGRAPPVRRAAYSR